MSMRVTSFTTTTSAPGPFLDGRPFVFHTSLLIYLLDRELQFIPFKLDRSIKVSLFITPTRSTTIGLEFVGSESQKSRDKRLLTIPMWTLKILQVGLTRLYRCLNSSTEKIIEKMRHSREEMTGRYHSSSFILFTLPQCSVLRTCLLPPHIQDTRNCHQRT
jgi:hypothetical protein